MIICRESARAGFAEIPSGVRSILLQVRSGNHRLQYKRNLLLAKSTVMDLEARISGSRHSLKELVEKRDFFQLNEIFTKYYQVQLSSAFIGREDFGGIYAFLSSCFAGSQRCDLFMQQC